MIAKLNPTLGASGVLEIMVTKVGVFIIFFLNGFSLSTDQLKAAATNWKLNLWTQFFSMGILPILYYLAMPFFPFQEMRSGLHCLSALPCTINMCITLTVAAGANAACAVSIK